MPIPVGYRVMLEIPQQEEKTKGGIILAEDTRKKEDLGSDIGIVSKLGPIAFKEDRLGGEPWIKEGEKVYYVRYAGIAMKTADGKMYRFINDEDIYGLVEEGDKDE